MIRNESASALSFAPLLEKYFLSFLINQKSASPRTVSSYRDSFRIYIFFLECRYDIDPDKVEMVHFSLDHLSTFGTYLEMDRNCAPATINLRMAAIKSFLKYAAIEAPEFSGLIRKSLSIPPRKCDKHVMTFLIKTEYEAILSVCDKGSFTGNRDKMMLMIMYNTGCRISELINIRVSDVELSGSDGTSSIRFFGKGRKERTTPVWKSTSAFINKYITANSLRRDDYLFKNVRNGRLTRSGASQRVSTLVKKAHEICSSLKNKNITPHTFRHSVAMNLLQAGIDISTIAIWLGHESIETTHKYMVADMDMKRRAMEKMAETENASYNYKPTKFILEFLKGL